jgi:formylglycine-generating enzyme required for sulfatase activity
MCAIDADIFGLVELENQNPANDPEPGDGIDNYVLKDLVGALNDAISPCPDKTYGFTDSPAIGTDPIRVDIIYKTGTVTPTGRAVLTDTAFTDPNGLGDDQSRPAVAETFEDANGEALTVVVNHFKSKGTPCGPGDDDPVQGNCNDTRTKGANYLVDWLATDPTGSGDPDFLLIGDLNAYAMEDPIAELTGEGFTDLVREYQGDKAYSYVFDGQLGYLDYGMANEGLLPQVTGTTVWHINTDEPDILDYDTSYTQDAQDALYEANAYRSSDHDPVIVGLQLTKYPFGTYLPLVLSAYSLDYSAIVSIPAGEFQMGCDDSHPTELCNSHELPLHTVYLDEYAIGKYEVTNAQYAEFLNAEGNQEEGGWTWLDADDPLVRIHESGGVWHPDAGYNNHPVAQVTWYGARAYCQWQGKRLPTEAEWEKAARGSSDTRRYPWGDEDPDCWRANSSLCVGDTTPVGSYPSGVSPYGALDMAGNVFEWVNDWYGIDYYDTSPHSNPQGPGVGQSKVVRGGDWLLVRFYVRVPGRNISPPDGYGKRSFGFRCACDVPGE